MELTQLKQFKAIAEKNSISLAAEDLHVSQPALSIAIKKMEQELGMPLFEHKGNKICLNEAGEIALKYVKGILLQEEQMKRNLLEYKNKQSRINIGFCDHGPLWYCAPKLILDGKEIAYSHYDTPTDEKELLQCGRYDILISSECLETAEITSRTFIRDRKYLSVSAGHVLAEEKEISARDSRIRELVLFILNDTFDTRQVPFWNEVKKQIKITTMTDYFLFHQKLQDPDVITTTTEMVRHYRNDGPNRVLIPLTDPELTIQYYISYLTEKEKEIEEVLYVLGQCERTLVSEERLD